jgi:outer membrane protein assembly factor BamB
MRHSDVKPGAYVASFDVATGRRLWRTFLGAADTAAAGRGDEITHNLLTLVGDRIFVNTNLGMIAALAAEDGRFAWLRRYDRADGRLSLPAPPHFDRDASPCVYHRGLVFVAPADTPMVFALDADHGQTLWASSQLAGATHLLGVTDGSLISSGRQLWAVDARSGRVRFAWPESENAGVRGFGRGFIAGREVFWPTRDRVYAFEITTGQPSREPIDISPFTTVGANLIAAEDCLLLVAPDRMMALGPRQKPTTRKQGANAVATTFSRRGQPQLTLSRQSIHGIGR